MEDIKVNKATIEDVEIIVTELCSNVIRHAKSKETHFLVTLTTVRVEKTLHYDTQGDADEAAARDKKGGGVVTASKG